MEVDGTDGDKNSQRQNKRDGSLLNTPQGSGGQASRGEAVCHEAVGGGCGDFSLFLVTVPIG